MEQVEDEGDRPTRQAWALIAGGRSTVTGGRGAVSTIARRSTNGVSVGVVTGGRGTISTIARSRGSIARGRGTVSTIAGRRGTIARSGGSITSGGTGVTLRDFVALRVVGVAVDLDGDVAGGSVVTNLTLGDLLLLLLVGDVAVDSVSDDGGGGGGGSDEEGLSDTTVTLSGGVGVLDLLLAVRVVGVHAVVCWLLLLLVL
mmetsp:Transcript_20047/g.32903  ORF Transcript_20047/g.32903 Transcript_20047/m.32903 type:complete len:201 (-) Transcript_20047:22-624(-)